MKKSLFMQRLNVVLNGSESHNKYLIAHNIFRRLLSFIIVIDLSAVVLSSFSEYTFLDPFFLGISFFSAFLFLIEYILRIYSAPAKRSHLKFLRARLKYLVSFMGIVDFVSILPFTIPYIALNDSDHLYIAELAKVGLMFKLARYSRTFKFIIDVFRSVRMELIFGWTIALSIVLFSGVLMYYVERNAQPDAFYNVGQGLWWAIITFATVGYGDIVPITGIGKLLAGVIAMIGIGMLALPAGIISSAFVKRMSEVKGKIASQGNTKATVESPENKPTSPQQRCYCPYCGAKLHEEQQE